MTVLLSLAWRQPQALDSLSWPSAQPGAGAGSSGVAVESAAPSCVYAALQAPIRLLADGYRADIARRLALREADRTGSFFAEAQFKQADR